MAAGTLVPQYILWNHGSLLSYLEFLLKPKSSTDILIPHKTSTLGYYTTVQLLQEFYQI